MGAKASEMGLSVASESSPKEGMTTSNAGMRIALKLSIVSVRLELFRTRENCGNVTFAPA